jgi:uncharacterized protein
MSLFAAFSLLAYAGIVLSALRRSRIFAIFAGVILGVYTLTSLGMRAHLGWPEWVLLYLQGAAYLHYFMFMRPRMRSLPWRVLVSTPASWFVAGTLLAFPWAIAGALGFTPALVWVPYTFAFVGLMESLWTRETVRDLVLDFADAGHLKRYPLGRSNGSATLSIVQITDPHLGPFMSVQKLSRICARAVERNPDLIFLTGDFLTIDSNRDPDALVRALAPLSAARGRVYACLGNHDHEAPQVVREALDAHGVTLLVDDAVVIDTKLGPTQVVGFDHRFRGRKAQVAEVLAKHPRPEGALRIVLLHDPSGFFRLPDGEADLVLSGHTHGGQLGFVTFGLPWTFLSAFTKIPDHGLWARGRNRLYVHRGTGHYGFPLRVGVPAEQSLLRIQRSH